MAKAIELTQDQVDTICDMLSEGKKWRDIADHLGMKLATLYLNINRNEKHSARAKEARDLSADSYAELAELILEQAEGTKEELMRARELAQHYRWMAGKRSPRRYGDKIDVTSDGEKIQATPFVVADKATKDKLTELGE